MEQTVTMEEKRNRDNALRSVIKTARERLGLQEKEVNERFHEGLKSQGIIAPRAIMTRVRDKRRPLEFSKAEANMLSAILKIDPAPLLPVETQASLLADEDQAPLTHNRKPSGESVMQTENTASEKEDVVSMAPAVEKALMPVRQEAANQITFVPKGQGLELRMDYVLTGVQLERFTLAIPAYMTKQENVRNGVRVKARVDIFPYQAELIMRAIFGRR